MIAREGVWDARDGRWLDGDGAKEASGLAVLPDSYEGSADAAYRCTRGDGEAAEVRLSATGEPVAWFPGQLQTEILPHPSGRIWVLQPQYSHQLYLLILEET